MNAVRRAVKGRIDYSAHSMDARLKTSTRVKHHCCYRLKKGERAGQLCGKPIESSHIVTDFCIDHTFRVLEKQP